MGFFQDSIINLIQVRRNSDVPIVHPCGNYSRCKQFSLHLGRRLSQIIAFEDRKLVILYPCFGLARTDENNKKK
jgi:hypothetical protein